MPPLGSTFGLVRGYEYGRAFTSLVELPPFAGNANPSYNIGGTFWERILIVSFRLQTDAVAGSRQALVRYLDHKGVIYAEVRSASTQPISVTAQWTFSVDLPILGSSAAASFTLPLPSIFLPPGHSIQLGVGSGDAGDTADHVRVLTEQFSTSPRDFPPGQGPELGEREYARDQTAHVDPYS